MTGFRQYRRPDPDGFTLVELMVALTLGLIVLGLVLTVYLGGMQAARFQNGLLRVQENGRFAIDALSRTMRMAGYDDPMNLPSLSAFNPPIEGVTNADDSDLLITTTTGTAIMANTDTIAVTFQGGLGTSIRDCQGSPIPLNTLRTSQYAVRDDFKLICLTDVMNNEEESELAEGVEDMQVLYGIDPDGNGVANHYVDAANIGAGNWDNITSVQITLLVNSVVNVLRTPDNFCMGCVVFPGSTDQLIRAEFQTTVDIRN
jgi:type IV pilus assembly protein PilW